MTIGLVPSFAGADVALLCDRVELARAHVLDHALTQRADGIGTHGELLSEVDNTSILGARRAITDACRACRDAACPRCERAAAASAKIR